MNVQLAKEYCQGMSGHKKDLTKFREPPIGWLMSEKFDGYRAIFCYDEAGQGKFYSRAGKTFQAPQWFLDAMPTHKLLGTRILDGELWAGRDNFQLMGVVRKKVPNDEEWTSIQYQVYDITNMDDTFVNRLKELQSIVKGTGCSWKRKKKQNLIDYPFHNLESPVVYATQVFIRSYEKMDAFYKEIVKGGGEGIMMKHPYQPYENGRSSYMLKYKPVFDREAMIVGYKGGDGKYKGLLGAFICKPLINHDTYMTIDEDEIHQFTLSGMDDAVRKDYETSHPKGSIITYECSGYTDKGKPRFGRYIRKRTDVVLKLDAEESEAVDKILLIKKIFKELEDHYRKNYDTFRVKTYRAVNQGLQSLHKNSDLTDETLKKIPGIGSGTKEKIRAILETGTCDAYEKILCAQKSPKEDFLKIHGVGPVQANKLMKAGFTSIEDLRACSNLDDHLNDVQRMGLQYYEEMQERIPYAEIQAHEVFLKKVLSEVDSDAELTIAGSYRRQKPTSGDIDLLVKGPKKTYEAFIQSLKDTGYLTCTLAHGPKKYMGLGLLDQDGYQSINRRIDIMCTTPSEYPFAIFYFTGSSEFNQRIRKEILDRGMTINEYSLKDNGTKKKVDHKFRTERDIFEYLGYEYVEPSDRID
jgi:DNA polymerase/3'-5' exonuclease PolX